MTGYKYAAVVQLTEPDTANSLPKGYTILVAGKHEDGYSYIAGDGRLGLSIDVECEVIERLEADCRMPKGEIIGWAADQERACGAAAEADR